MNKVIVLLGALILCLPMTYCAADLVWQDIGRGMTDVSAVLVGPDDPRVIYAGSADGLFKTEDGGMNWKNILSMAGQKRKVNFLLVDPKDKNILYAAAKQGVFYSVNAGRNWNRIFSGKNAFESECVSVAVLPSGIYLGTKAGLFISKDRGRTWNKESGKIGESPVLAISFDVNEPDYIYAACLDGVYQTRDSGKTWERIFVSHPVENGDEGTEPEEETDEEMRFSDIRYISIDPHNTNQVYLATRKGVYISRDKGKTWEAMTEYGLLSREIEFILVKSAIYAVTKSGVFEYKNERWHELTLGLVTNNIRFLAQDKPGNLYAACDNGLFRAELKNSPKEEKGSLISLYGKDEPKISEVQEAAIRYAEVEPEKIKAWRNQAAKKAFMPQLSIGVDRNTSDLWHWESGSTTKPEDDNLVRGHDSIDWDVSLSWDLSELIWNNDQTSIDVRSRLLVELRDDILDQATKLYFERLRVKAEMDDLSIEDRKKRFEKELRLQELSAMLDALTGGYFSRQIQNKG